MLNDLTIDEYLKNRERYIKEGRALEGNAAQKAARNSKLLTDIVRSGKTTLKNIGEEIGKKEVPKWISVEQVFPCRRTNNFKSWKYENRNIIPRRSPSFQSIIYYLEI